MPHDDHLNWTSEAESFRHFHDGPLERCEHCGRIVFRPCLACTLERSGQVHDPFEESREAVDELRLQLQGEDRQRYENLRRKKAIESIRHDKESA